MSSQVRVDWAMSPPVITLITIASGRTTEITMPAENAAYIGCQLLKAANAVDSSLPAPPNVTFRFEDGTVR